MVNIKNRGYISPFAVHPGETVREALEYSGLSQADLSERTQISEKTISLILSGQQPVTPETALKLERVLGLSYDLLVGMQAQYEADAFRLAEQKRLEEEVSFLPSFSCFSELVKLGYLEAVKEPTRKVEELLKFFGVNSLSSVPTVFKAAWKKSDKQNISNESLAAWLHIGKIESLKREVRDFDADKLKENIVKMRALTKEKADVFAPALIDLCAEAGVVLVFTPHFKNTRVNGAARWLTPKKALVQISLYNKYADIFWFTLFHELGHILKHSKKLSFVDDLGDLEVNEMEDQANKFAQQIIVPAEKEKEFDILKTQLNTSNVKEKVVGFSKQIDIDPGIIAGRIGREMDAWRYVSPLRRRLEFK